jgi:hypothetical protein
MSDLGAFNTQLIRFFEQLSESYPEERDIKLALQGIHGAKIINPKLILDLFYEHVCKDLKPAIMDENSQVLIQYAKYKISNQFNEMSPALLIFDKHWDTMSQENRKVIWNYLKVLCTLCERAKASKTTF